MSLLGVTVLVLRRHYSGPGGQLVLSYAGNLGVSFAMYFAAASSMQKSAHPRLYAALMALAAVTLFEVTDGFGFMANVWDAWDLAANAVGILLALVVDRATARLVSSRPDRHLDADGRGPGAGGHPDQRRDACT